MTNEVLSQELVKLARDIGDINRTFRWVFLWQLGITCINILWAILLWTR